MDQPTGVATFGTPGDATGPTDVVTGTTGASSSDTTTGIDGSSEAGTVADTTSAVLDGTTTTDPDGTSSSGGCVAQTELCDGRDDDCDFVVDAGCPSAVDIDPSPFLGLALGDDEGGIAYDDLCPAGHVIVGFRGRAAERLVQIQAICAAFELVVDDTTVPEYAYAMQWSGEVLGTVHGGATGTAFEERCTGSDVVIGFDGESGTEVDQFAFVCGAVTMARDGDAWALTITPTTTSTTWGNDPAGPFVYDCPNAVAVGIHGRAGARVDRLGYHCAPLVLKTIAP